MDPNTAEKISKPNKRTAREVGSLMDPGVAADLAKQKMNEKKFERAMEYVGIIFLVLLAFLVLWSLWDIFQWKCRRRNPEPAKKSYKKGHGFPPEVREAMNEDPELKAMVEDLEANGSKALQKYLDNAELMEKVEELKRRFGITGAKPTPADVTDGKEAKDPSDPQDTTDARVPEDAKEKQESSSEAGELKRRIGAPGGEASADAKGSAKEMS
mmetsp:Transcript_124614/g.363884  ORF Transcript_124614/g.363884 Transcript_124614/m.363884 type:complete len:213 (-) Transcript_124614:224-862(-)